MKLMMQCLKMLVNAWLFQNPNLNWKLIFYYPISDIHHGAIAWKPPERKVQETAGAAKPAGKWTSTPRFYPRNQSKTRRATTEDRA